MKKTERLWLPWKLCFDPFMACRIRDGAEKNFRKIEDHMRFLIIAGLDDTDRREGKGQLLPIQGIGGQR